MQKMELFENIPDPDFNVLPQDGTVNYHGKIFNQEEADFFSEKLRETIVWKNDEAIICGKKF